MPQLFWQTQFEDKKIEVSFTFALIIYYNSRSPENISRKEVFDPTHENFFLFSV